MQCLACQPSVSIFSVSPASPLFQYAVSPLPANCFNMQCLVCQPTISICSGSPASPLFQYAVSRLPAYCFNFQCLACQPTVSICSVPPASPLFQYSVSRLPAHGFNMQFLACQPTVSICSVSPASPLFQNQSYRKLLNKVYIADADEIKVQSPSVTRRLKCDINCSPLFSFSVTVWPKQVIYEVVKYEVWIGHNSV